MRPNLVVVTAALILGLVILLAVVFTEKSAGEDLEPVTTNDTTTTTRWVETQPALGDGFDELLAGVARAKAAHRPRRMKASAVPAPGGAPYPTDQLLERLARCETGGKMNQDATSPDGRYLSFFQWLLSTWHSVGGTGDPRDHTYAEQVPLARALILRRGWGQFPRCSRAIGAR